MNELKKHLQNIEQDKINDLTIRPDFTFHDNVNRQIDAESVTVADGRRHYILPNGNKLPSVTTVLGATKSAKDKKSLADWRKRVGEEEAERIITAAAARGSKLHEMCEYFILADDRFEIPKMGTNAFALWKQMHPLMNRIDNIHNLEGALYSEKLGIAGRTDCVAEFDGVLSIIDFKSARKRRKEEWLTDYYCQETAYAIMFGEMYGVKVKQIVTLMAIDYNMTSPQAEVIVKKPIDYVELLVKRVRQYQKLAEAGMLK